VKVLVTGSSGFIGLNACESFRTFGYEVRGADVASSENAVDIRDFKLLCKVFSEFRPDVVLHLAALASVPESERDPPKAYTTNVMGTLNVVECANRLNAKAILASSAAVYGQPEILPTPETVPLSPTNIYGATKIAAEHIVNLRAKEGLIFRLFNVYGPNCNRSYVIPDTIRKAINGENPICAQGTGQEKRDFVYVTDVIDAFRLGMERELEGTFNVGSGETISMKDLISKIISVSGSEAQLTFAGSSRLGDFPCNWADLSKIKTMLDWSPKISLEEGLRKTIGWYRKIAKKV
jgi:UDP-glucose 4-epimerase